jgi:DNA (cytosine-5)-methyltransferase 1
MNNLITVSEVAHELGVSVDTIRRWEKKGLIKGSRSAQNYRMFDLAEAKALHDKLSGNNQSEHPFTILKNNKKKVYTAIDLFSGAGGTALGLENAGFKHVLVNEFDKNAAETLRINRPEWNVVQDDVANVDFTPYLGKVDVIEGGFPCQAFSYAGKKRGFDDTRGTLFHEFARAVNEARPKVAIGENVKGLLSHDNGRTLSVMVGTLQKLGYKVAYRVLRAQYLDVAQKRERLVIIAVRDDLDIPFLYPKEQNYTVSMREALADCPKSPGQEYSEAKRKIMEMVPPGGYWRDLPLNVQKDYMMRSFYLGGGKTGMARRLSWDEPSLTLTCTPAQKQTERCHPEETRPLTVREYARVQSFPDEWKFAGSVSSQYKQIGNAVPVNLGYHMGDAVIAMLENKPDSKKFEIVEPIATVNEGEIVAEKILA